MITFCLTSCNRPDLLETTMDSFLKFNSFPIDRFIIQDDSGEKGCIDFIKRKYPFIELYYNEKRMGMMGNIEKLYDRVKTKWIFHCEDDWEFTRTGFIVESLRIMQTSPNILIVWLRDVNDTNGHPVEPEEFFIPGARFKYVSTGYMDWFHGYTTNPGLRRKADAIKFSDIIGDIQPGEHLVSRYYFEKGFRSVILLPAAVKHTGEGRSTIQ
jgi:GT2 family glycosyltransferase